MKGDNSEPSDLVVMDLQSERMLGRQADRIGLIHETAGERGADKLVKDGVETYCSETLHIGDSIVRGVGADEEALYNQLPAMGEGESGAHAYVVDWPVTVSGCRQYVSLYFSQLPSREDVIKAGQIRRTAIEIRSQVVPQNYRCRVCDKRVHWTDLVSRADGAIAPARELAIERHCGCNERLEEERNRLDPVPEDQDVAKPHHTGTMIQTKNISSAESSH